MHAKPGDRVAQHAGFGPFVTVTTFRTGDEALAIAARVACGLGAGLWTRDRQRAHGFARGSERRCGWLQAREPRLAARQRLRERRRCAKSFDAMHEYIHAKSVWFDVDAQIPPYYPR
ncbi:aldehyde dehydrogenase family protein [Burkholderia multivorans]|uniref:aldehyde dehydrogenase family protein n=1 Tax=Burkholderia multivorans TaxID=87883 RepID=UPI0021C1C752|nr:aldehyde dehydrogenase family protein [Burkholderia multivorans]